MATDPVCGMTVDEKQAAAKAVYEGKTYYFCSESCHKAFTVEPAKYAGSAAPGGHGGSHRHGHE